MERNKMMQVLFPALAAAGVVILIGVLIAMSDWGGKTSASGKAAAKNSVGGADMNDSGMVDTLPALDSPDWKTRADGMRTWDVKEGDGDECPRGASVIIHYTGWTLEGTVFDSSRGKGAPADFRLSGLIQGWQEGIPGMKPGGIRRLKIPYHMAYGEAGSPPKIPPKATLVFEVKLLGFK